MKQRLRILHVEDDPKDAELVLTVLTDEGIECEALVVATREDFSAALERGGFEQIPADFALPAFTAGPALVPSLYQTW
jgi:CheY-like chemotaxis protein